MCQPADDKAEVAALRTSLAAAEARATTAERELHTVLQRETDTIKRHDDKFDRLERQLAEAVEVGTALAKDYVWTRGKDMDARVDLSDDTQFSIYAAEHPVQRFRRFLTSLMEKPAAARESK